MQFSNLTSTFGSFQGKFAGWAKSKQAELDNDIKELNKAISDLGTKLKGLQSDLMIAVAAIAAGATVLVSAMALAGPFAPFVAVRTYRSHRGRYLC